jgi:hypothetical protein
VAVSFSLKNIVFCLRALPHGPTFKADKSCPVYSVQNVKNTQNLELSTQYAHYHTYYKKSHRIRHPMAVKYRTPYARFFATFV